MGDNIWHVIGRGFAGWHATGINTSESGGNLNDYRWNDGMTKGYLSNAIEGALVYDAKHLEQTDSAKDFFKLVINGPMVKPDLPPDAIERFSSKQRETAKLMMPGLSGGFDTLAKLAQNEKFSGLDYVGVKVYESLLRQIPGIKIGHVRDGAVVWDS